jgi:lysozyme family protein
MRALTPDVVAPIYKRDYWDACRCDDLPDGVDYAVFDLAVNSGTRRAAKMLQKAAGVPDDGAVGPATLKAVAECNPRDLAADICENRLAFLQALPTWDVFGKGWSRRVAEVEQMSFNMVG